MGGGRHIAALQGIESVVIDLDGTLVDTLLDFAAAVNAMLRDLGLDPLDVSVVERHIGKGAENLVMQTLGEAGAPDTRFEEAWPIYLAHYERVNGAQAVVYPGVLEGLARFAARDIQLAVLTNKPVSFARSLLQATGLFRYFTCVHGGDSFARKKPDPLSLLATCKVLDTAPERTLMVGDSVNDSAAGRAAGCATALVTYGYSPGRPVREIDADAHVDALDELERLVNVEPRPTHPPAIR